MPVLILCTSTWLADMTLRQMCSGLELLVAHVQHTADATIQDTIFIRTSFKFMSLAGATHFSQMPLNPFVPP